jgi:foldase protein PrsA
MTYKPPPKSRFFEPDAKAGVVHFSNKRGCVMADWMQARTAAARRWWPAYAIAGTAAVLVCGGIYLQTIKATSAYPDTGRATVKSPPVAQGKSTGAATSKVVARVNTDIVSYDELAEECVSRIGREALDDLINQKIVEQACRDAGVEITDMEINDEIVRMSQGLDFTPEQYMQMIQTEARMSPEKFRRQRIWPILALRKLSGGKVEVSKDEMQRRFIRNFGPRVEARWIVLDNQRKAAKVWEAAVESPDDFERLAKEHSIDPSSRPLGGQIPPIARYGGNELIEKAAFKLKKGEISAVIQLDPHNFAILKSEGLTEQIVTDMKSVEEELRKELLEEKSQQIAHATFSRLREDSRIVNMITGETHAGNKKSAGDAAVRPAGGKGGKARGAVKTAASPNDE